MEVVTGPRNSGRKDLQPSEKCKFDSFLKNCPLRIICDASKQGLGQFHNKTKRTTGNRLRTHPDFQKVLKQNIQFLNLSC